jgi:hypothetical protein
VLAAVRVEPDLSDPTRTSVPIRVSVLPSATKGFRLGAGLEIDVARADVHGVLGWEHRNFLGGLRRLTLEERPAVVLYPTALPALAPPTRVLPANRATLAFEQPALFEARTRGTLRVEQSIYPVIVPPPDPHADIILGYRELRGVVGPQREFPLAHVSTALFYDVQASWPFTYLGPLDPELSRVLASYVQGIVTLDLRDDPIAPHEMRLYCPVGDEVTLAARTELGFLFPRNYGATLRDPVPSVRDLQLLYFRGFFSGGPDSNRGYAYRDIGPHGIAPFFIPGSVAAARARCAPDSPDYDPRLCSVALGGISLWEASLELRFPVVGDLGAVLFADASDVSNERLSVRLDRPHLSSGFGIRYATPVGPLRIDVGFRIPGAQKIGGELNPLTEGHPSTIAGVPAAVAIGLGEAF